MCRHGGDRHEPSPVRSSRCWNPAILRSVIESVASHISTKRCHLNAATFAASVSRPIISYNIVHRDCASRSEIRGNCRGATIYLCGQRSAHTVRKAATFEHRRAGRIGRRCCIASPYKIGHAGPRCAFCSELIVASAGAELMLWCEEQQINCRFAEKVADGSRSSSNSSKRPVTAAWPVRPLTASTASCGDAGRV